MARTVKDIVDVPGNTSLDALIAQLVAIREALPDDHEAEVKLRGDDVFGRKLSIAYQRPQTPEEAEYEERYAAAYRASRERVIEAQARPPRGRRLRMVS